MNRKAKSRNKGGRNEVNVRPINDRIEPYDEALATYRSHPSAPTFLLLIDRALDAGIRLKSLESELNNIVSVPDDQFFGAHGSKYFARNHNALLEAKSLRPLEPHVDALCEVVWQVLRRVQSSEVWVYGDYLTGIGDFVHLSESDSEVDVGATEINGPSTVLGEGDAASAVKAAISMFIQGVEESERARTTISDLAQQHGHSLVPWAAWILDQLESRPDLQEGLEDFEEYLKLYFNCSSEMETADSHVKPMKLDRENSSALLGFAAFLMFFALYRRTLYEDGSFEISTFFPE